MDEIKHQWREFGIALGFSYTDLEAIEVAGLGKPGRCIQSIFGEWSEKKSNTYHWKGLIAALNTAGFTDLATRVTCAIENPILASTGLGMLIIKNKYSITLHGHKCYGNSVADVGGDPGVQRNHPFKPES